MTDVIFNSLKSAALQVTALSDPSRLLAVQAKVVDALSSTMATQMNEQRAAFAPSVSCVDLEQYIVDIRIETTTQGSSFLEVDITDPYWALLARNAQGASFFDVADDGFLWPPIEIAFPPDQTDQEWVLCALKPSTDVSAANITLTFEDKIVAECRNHDNSTDPALATSGADETRAEFIRRALETAVPGIRFIPLLRIGSPAAFFATDLTTGVPPPKSVKTRKNYKKKAGVSDKTRGTANTKRLLNGPGNPFTDPFVSIGQGGFIGFGNAAASPADIGPSPGSG